MKPLEARTIKPPAWFARLLMPLISRIVAREMVNKYPDLGPQEIAEKMRAEIPSGVSEQEALRLIDRVVARFPQKGTSPALPHDALRKPSG